MVPGTRQVLQQRGRAAKDVSAKDKVVLSTHPSTIHTLDENCNPQEFKSRGRMITYAAGTSIPPITSVE